jgi:hypothetical protein
MHIDRGPDPGGGTRELLKGLGFTDVTILHRTEHGIEFVELDLIDRQRVQNVRGKGFELLRGLDQPLEAWVRIDLEHPGRVSAAQSFGQTGDDVHDELSRRALPMQDGAMGLREIAKARDALRLAPGLAAGMPIGADVPASEPAVRGTIVIRTARLCGVDGAPASPGEDAHRRGRGGGCGTSIEAVRTRIAQRFMDASSAGFGRFGAGSSGLVRLAWPAKCGPGSVGPPGMGDEAEQHESDQEELVKQQVRCHDNVPFADDDRRLFYRNHPLSNYPLHGGTPPKSKQMGLVCENVHKNNYFIEIMWC